MNLIAQATCLTPDYRTSKKKLPFTLDAASVKAGGDGRFYIEYPYRGRIMKRAVLRRVCSQCKREFFSIRQKSPDQQRFYCIRSCWIKSRSGSGSERWRGGIKKTEGKKFLVYSPDHPFARNRYVLHHRLVLEKDLGRFLREDEHVHHIDGDEANDEPDNLIAVSDAQHKKLHGQIVLLLKPLMKAGVLVFNRETLTYEIKEKQ